MVPLCPHANLDSEANAFWQVEAGQAEGEVAPWASALEEGSGQRGEGWRGVGWRGGRHSSFHWLHIVNGGPCSG